MLVFIQAGLCIWCLLALITPPLVYITQSTMLLRTPGMIRKEMFENECAYLEGLDVLLNVFLVPIRVRAAYSGTRGVGCMQYRKHSDSHLDWRVQ